jgi:hypothetical protein
VGSVKKIIYPKKEKPIHPAFFVLRKAVGVQSF